ncbi:MAG: glycosyl transferase family 39 [Mycobacteriaceae bacterium]|nr:glycosyl transferase family 39 [Mycobacteriaceae bacterium]
MGVLGEAAAGAVRERDETPAFASAGVAVVAALGALALIVSMGRYQFFGDELYFISAGRRLSWSYADQGPLVPLLARAMDLIAPESMVALRVPAVMATVGAIVLCALIARELGGSAAAQVLAAAAYATSPFLLGQGNTLSTNAIDTPLWVLASWLLVRWVRTRRDVLLLWAAVVTAVDMQVKWLIPFFWFAVAVGVCLVGPRCLLRRRTLWAGALVVAVTMVPSLLWQARHGWPQLALGRAVAAEQDAIGGRVVFVPLTAVIAGVLGGVLLLCGVWALWRSDALRPYRFLGVALPLLILAFVAVNGRPYYPSGCYAVVIAAGAVWAAGAPVATWRKVAVVPLTLASVVLAAASLPWKPERDLPPARPDDAIGLLLYGRFGWTELARTAARVYRDLPPEDRGRTVFVTRSYWQAAALDVYRYTYGMPAAYSWSRGFGYFGAPPNRATTVILVARDATEMQSLFASVTPIGRADARLGLPGVSRDVTFWRCDHPRQPWSTAWPGLMRLN